ncbi:MAG: sodium:proton antiporter [Phycisphaerales bacterium]
MAKVVTFSVLLIVGMILSQILPRWTGGSETATHVIQILTFTTLAFIMIHVGYEFDIDKRKKAQYGADFAIAMTAASFPWLFVSAYFVLVMGPPGAATSWEQWRDELLVGCFAAPTSAGVLFSMLAAAGLSATWLFKKARVLAIFDDIGTILLLIPLKIMIVGMQWQLAVVIFIMVGLIAVAWFMLHKVRIPITWPWVLGYSIGLVAASEALAWTSHLFDDRGSVHIEVLLPSFVLGCIIAQPRRADGTIDHTHHEPKGTEAMMGTLISGVFLLLVGLSMPHLDKISSHPDSTEPVEAINWGMIALHVLAVTLLSNLGKMFPVLCYKREASLRARMALSVGMWPRGEVGAGILVVALSYHIGGQTVLVAVISLALNLVLTGGFIVLVKKLLAGDERAQAAAS